MINTDALRVAIQESNRIVVASHVNPDGDSIGSTLAMLSALRALGKDASAVSSDPVRANLRFLSGWDEIEIIPEGGAAPVGFDLGILVDVNSIRRIGRAAASIETARRLAVIDHHVEGGEKIDGIRIVQQEAAATCLMLYEILPQLGVIITPEIAECLLTGIVTDTGSFRFANASPESLRVAHELMALGAGLHRINENVWASKPLQAIKLLGSALEHLMTSSEGRIVYSSLYSTDFSSADAQDEDTEGIINEIGKLETALISALFRETRPGKVRVSVRSRGNIDVAAVCRDFGGGGHTNAAGCNFDSTIEEAQDQLLPALETCLESC